MKHLPSFLTLLAPALLTICTVHAANPTYRNAVLSDGAISYFQFDETSGTTAADASTTLGGINNGTLVGNVALAQPSAFAGLGTAYGFSGADATAGRVRFLDNPAFDFGTGPFSIELWYKTDTAARGDLFTYKGTGGDFGIHSNSNASPAGFSSSVSVWFNGYEGFTASNSVGSNISLWHHVALTRDASSLISIYIDGSLKGTAVDADSMNIASDLLIGTNHTGDPSNPTLNFIGSIDEVAVYGSALSPGQISNHIALANVPEPASASLLLLGVAALTARRRSPRR